MLNSLSACTLAQQMNSSHVFYSHAAGIRWLFLLIGTTYVSLGQDPKICRNLREYHHCSSYGAVIPCILLNECLPHGPPWENFVPLRNGGRNIRRGETGTLAGLVEFCINTDVLILDRKNNFFLSKWLYDRISSKPSPVCCAIQNSSF